MFCTNLRPCAYETFQVRCDIQETAPQPCKNCSIASRPCKYVTLSTCRLQLHVERNLDRLREGIRRRRGVKHAQPQDTRWGGGPNVDDLTLATPSPLTPAVVVPDDSSSAAAGAGQSRVTGSGVVFFPAHSMLSWEPHSAAISSPHDNLVLPSLRDTVLEAAKALEVPTEPLRQALFDAYFDELHSRFPVVDRRDLTLYGQSYLLIQVICLAGSLMRPMYGKEDAKLSRSLYEKVKMLIYMNHETHNLVLLKATCLLSIWNPLSPTVLHLDGTLHWTGVAMRIAIGMGLHRESNYKESDNIGARRRLWWHLHVSGLLMLPIASHGVAQG